MNKKGFTLLETLVAVAILALAVTGPLYVADRALVAAQTSRDQLTASYLAQEGIEYVRSMRDHEFLFAYNADRSTARDASWQAFVFSGGSGVGSIASCRAQNCSLDPFATGGMGVGSGKTLRACGTSCTQLYLTADKRYTQSSGGGATVTPFTRTIKAVLISANDLQVVTTVSWSNRGATNIVRVTDNLTPWQ